MSAEAKKGYGSTMILLILGVLALYGGALWLLLLIPAAVVGVVRLDRRVVQEKPELTEGGS